MVVNTWQTETDLPIITMVLMCFEKTMQVKIVEAKAKSHIPLYEILQNFTIDNGR